MLFVDVFRVDMLAKYISTFTMISPANGIHVIYNKVRVNCLVIKLGARSGSL